MPNFLSLGPGCSGNFWTTPNIQISTGVFTVDVPAWISLIISNTGHFFPSRVNEAQAVVCALNTLTYFDSRLVLPSLRPKGLDLPLKDQDIEEGQSTGTPGRPNIALGPWTPTVNDITFFEKMAGSEFQEIGFSRYLHVCVFANCAGTSPASNDTTPINQDGAPVTWDDATLGDTSFCADQHHAQLNTTLHRTLNKNALTLTVPFYGGIPKKREVGPVKVKVFLREQVFEPQADQGLVGMIRRAGLDGLPIQPAPVPARVAGIARFRGVGERIEQKAEEIVKEAREGLEHLRGHWAYQDDESDPGTPRNVLTLHLAPGELQPLLLKVALDKDDPLGAVHVFDVVQLNQDGTRGGFRLATIHTPAE